MKKTLEMVFIFFLIGVSLLAGLFLGNYLSEKTTAQTQQTALTEGGFTDQEMDWDISRLDEQRYFQGFGSSYFKLRAPGEPCAVYGRDKLYFACYQDGQWTHENC